MNRIEFIILALIAIIAAIFFIKSRTFSRWLDWLIGAEPVDADSLKRRAQELGATRNNFEKSLEEAKSNLAKEQKKIEKVKV